MEKPTKVEIGQRWKDASGEYAITAVASNSEYRFRRTDGQNLGGSGLVDPTVADVFLGWGPGFGPSTAPIAPPLRPEPAVGQRWQRRDRPGVWQIVSIRAADPKAWPDFRVRVVREDDEHPDGWSMPFGPVAEFIADAPVPSPGVAPACPRCAGRGNWTGPLGTVTCGDCRGASPGVAPTPILCRVPHPLADGGYCGRPRGHAGTHFDGSHEAREEDALILTSKPPLVFTASEYQRALESLGAKASAPGGQGPKSAPALPTPHPGCYRLPHGIDMDGWKPCDDPTGCKAPRKTPIAKLEPPASALCHTCRLGSACTHGPKVREPYIPAVDFWDLLPDA